jgi:hypothetical protein
MVMKKWLFLILAVLLLVLAYKKLFIPLKMKTDLYQWARSFGLDYPERKHFEAACEAMSQSELDIVYKYVFDYIDKGKGVTDPVFFKNIKEVSSKYGIF